MTAFLLEAIEISRPTSAFLAFRFVDIFVERKRRTENSPMVCHCKPPPPGAGRVGCGEDCYNRVMFYECVSAFCPCGDQCSNQRFQMKHNTDHLRVIWVRKSLILYRKWEGNGMALCSSLVINSYFLDGGARFRHSNLRTNQKGQPCD